MKSTLNVSLVKSEKISINNLKNALKQCRTVQPSMERRSTRNDVPFLFVYIYAILPKFSRHLGVLTSDYFNLGHQRTGKCPRDSGKQITGANVIVAR